MLHRRARDAEDTHAVERDGLEHPNALPRPGRVREDGNRAHVVMHFQRANSVAVRQAATNAAEKCADDEQVDERGAACHECGEQPQAAIREAIAARRRTTDTMRLYPFVAVLVASLAPVIACSGTSTTAIEPAGGEPGAEPDPSSGSSGSSGASGGTTDGGRDAACVQACGDHDCGPDNCGGSCGTCGATEACSATRHCVCKPQCSGKTCGPDGCGGTCGTCAGTDACSPAGKCTCTPSCTGKTCGSDGCGGSCGTCSAGTCNSFFFCGGATCGATTCGSHAACCQCSGQPICFAFQPGGKCSDVGAGCK